MTLPSYVFYFRSGFTALLFSFLASKRLVEKEYRKEDESSIDIETTCVYVIFSTP